jgi:hypothetical protein
MLSLKSPQSRSAAFRSINPVVLRKYSASFAGLFVREASSLPEVATCSCSFQFRLFVQVADRGGLGSTRVSLVAASADLDCNGETSSDTTQQSSRTHVHEEDAVGTDVDAPKSPSDPGVLHEDMSHQSPAVKKDHAGKASGQQHAAAPQEEDGYDGGEGDHSASEHSDDGASSIGGRLKLEDRLSSPGAQTSAGRGGSRKSGRGLSFADLELLEQKDIVLDSSVRLPPCFSPCWQERVGPSPATGKLELMSVVVDMLVGLPAERVGS